MSRVQIAFQDNDESRYIVAAIEQDNTTAVVHYEPAMIRVENEGSLIINRDTVSEQIGMEWDVQSLHIIVTKELIGVPSSRKHNALSS